MAAEKCKGKTQQGKPCRNNAVENGFCKKHSEQAGEKPKAKPKAKAKAKAKPKAESPSASEETTASFDAIVNAGAKLVDALEKAINHTPKTMDRLFKYSGAQLMAPGLAEKMQARATDTTRARLQKMQLDFINLGADPSKLDQLLEQTRKLEATVETTLSIGGKFLPASLREELKNSLGKLRKLHK